MSHSKDNKITPFEGLPSKSDIEEALLEIFQPYIVKRYGEYNRGREFNPFNLLRMAYVLNKSRRKEREETFVKEQYENFWEHRDLADFQTNSTNTCPGNWRGEAFEIVKLGIKRAHLYLLGEIINTLQPSSALEVGCGMGVNLAFLARKCPSTVFSGVELTANGVTRAKEIIQNTPKELLDFYPSSLSEKSSFSSFPKVYQASAKDLPFEDNSVDFVYSVQALEQMNQIRFDVLKEFHRVTSKYVCCVEAFKDYNRGSHALNIIKRDYFQGTVKELSDHGFRVRMIYDDLPTKNKMKIVCVLAQKNSLSA